jgi:hypothetical protein
MGELWDRDGVATGPQLFEAVHAQSSSVTRGNLNTALARLAEYGWVRPIEGPRGGAGKGSGKRGRSPTLWKAELTKAQFFATSFRDVLELFARVGRSQVDPEAVELIQAEANKLPRA